MIIVVDAYNVLKRETHSTIVSHQERVRFLSYISAYSKQKGHELIVVFDGGESSWPSVTKQRHVTVVYSGTQRSADDYIRSYLTQNARKDIVLVSSDNELNHWAEKYTIPSVDSDVFYTKLSQTVHMAEPLRVSLSSPLVKTSENSNGLLDAIMEEGSVYVQQKDEGSAKQYRHEKKVGTKKEKRLIEILKKL